MKIFIIVGMPAAGKNIAREYAEKNNRPYYSTGDIVRAEVKKRDISANAENMAIVSTELRGNDGLGVTRQVLKEALNKKASLMFLEGIRSWPEIKLIKKSTDCLVISFLAPRNIRLKRIQERGRADDSVDHFNDRDWREINYGVAACIAMADEYVLNTGTIEDAFIQLDKIVNKNLI